MRQCWTCSYFKCECSILLVDDGFWEGELNGRVGVFPSLVVELLHDEREEEDKEEEVRLLCSLWLQRIAETHLTVYISFLTVSLFILLQSLLTPTMPPFSPSSPSPTNPGCSSALSVTPPSCEEDTQQVFADNTAEPEGSSHSSPDFSGGRLRPCRAPPPPPTHKRSPQP
ncbi:F-BAR and double SH3 domains protein 2 [Dissostichus eleginoides]|uniref:F-BAR and double SH3 domains protein 2 n=1 Tax=Dissostichus eleginoides TaxID=100907 RepID=A0AAD9FMG2_DISEL|nr:F-BAR and double SH3 domains protein 2 [Dissostichus eleginoides]